MVPVRAPADARLTVAQFQHHGQAPFGEPAGWAAESLQRWQPFGGGMRALGERATPAAAAAVKRHEAIAQRHLGCGLKRGVQAGANDEAAALRLVLPEAGEEFAAHILGEMAAHGQHFGAAQRAGQDGLCAGGDGLLRGNHALLQHAIQHPVAANARLFGEAQRVVVVGRLGQGGQEGHLGNGQLVQRLVEIGLGRGGHTIGLRAEEDFIEVDFQDARLGQGVLKADGQQRLTRFSQHGAIASDQHVLGHLLSNGGGTYHTPPAAILLDVRHDGAHHGNGIHAVVALEILVLSRDEGLLEAAGDGLDGHEDPAFGSEFGHEAAVTSVDSAHLRRRVIGEPAVIRQPGLQRPVQAESRDTAAQRHDGDQQEERADEAAEQPEWRPPGRRWRGKLARPWRHDRGLNLGQRRIHGAALP